MSGRSLPLCCTLTLIAMQGDQTKNKKNVVHEETCIITIAKSGLTMLIHTFSGLVGKQIRVEVSNQRIRDCLRDK